MTPDDEQEGRDSSSGRFLPGNSFWANKSSFGRKPKFETPEDLEAACIEYFESAQHTPLLEEQVAGKDAIRVTVHKMHAMTLKELWLFLDISHQNWYEYAKRDGYKAVCEWAQNVIFVQKFTGAAAGLLNPAIISRELGLADKKELSGPDGTPIRTEEVSPRERISSKLARIAAAGAAGSDTGGTD